MTIVSACYVTGLPSVTGIVDLCFVDNLSNVGVIGVLLNVGKTVDFGKLGIDDDGVIGLAVEFRWLFVP